jgi:hypothetical protein
MERLVLVHAQDSRLTEIYRRLGEEGYDVMVIEGCPEQIKEAMSLMEEAGFGDEYDGEQVIPEGVEIVEIDIFKDELEMSVMPAEAQLVEEE